MAKAEVMSFGKPDEVRKFPKGHLELIKIGGATVGRAVFEPGWKWSESLQPIDISGSLFALLMALQRLRTWHF